MFFAQIKHRMTIADFTASFPQIKTTLPQQKDFAPDKWPEMQHKSFATFHEPTAAGDLLYRLTFHQGTLCHIQISINGDFTQDAHQAISAIAGQIVTAQSARGMTGNREIAPLLAWKELIESPLPDSGKPDERYIPIYRATWTLENFNAALNYSWTWPGQLAMEYREVEKP